LARTLQSNHSAISVHKLNASINQSQWYTYCKRITNHGETRDESLSQNPEIHLKSCSQVLQSWLRFWRRPQAFLLNTRNEEKEGDYAAGSIGLSDILNKNILQGF